MDCRYDHFPTYTGPGHAAILTGTGPAGNGIIGNVWYDKNQDKTVYCVDDARYKVVGAADGSKARPMGPANLKSTTVGDELKLATANKSKVVTIAIKDRASILLGGHANDVSIWYDDAGGRWISSTAFARDGKLPAWVEAINDKKIPSKSAATTWKPGLSKEALSTTFETKNPGNVGYGLKFDHVITADPAKATKQFTYMPAANYFVLQTAAEAVRAEGLGSRSTPDLLALNLSTNDYVGHQFGPYSPEVMDLSVETDKALSQFFNSLDKQVGLKDVVIALTADHGVAPVPDDLQSFNMPGSRSNEDAVVEKVQEALDAAYGPHAWFGKKNIGFVEPYLSFNAETIRAVLAEKKAASLAEIRNVAAAAVRALPDIYTCYTWDEVLHGQVARDEIGHLISMGFFPSLSGDLVIVPNAGVLIEGKGGTGTSHGTPWAYDIAVPMLLVGPGVQPGIHTERVAVQDLAPTLAQLLGIINPSACRGKVLVGSLK